MMHFSLHSKTELFYSRLCKVLDFLQFSDTRLCNVQNIKIWLIQFRVKPTLNSDKHFFCLNHYSKLIEVMNVSTTVSYSIYTGCSFMNKLQSVEQICHLQKLATISHRKKCTEVLVAIRESGNTRRP